MGFLEILGVIFAGIVLAIIATVSLALFWPMILMLLCNYYVWHAWTGFGLVGFIGATLVVQTMWIMMTEDY